MQRDEGEDKVARTVALTVMSTYGRLSYMASARRVLVRGSGQVQLLQVRAHHGTPSPAD